MVGFNPAIDELAERSIVDEDDRTFRILRVCCRVEERGTENHL